MAADSPEQLNQTGRFPDISGNHVVWRGHDLATGEFNITLRDLRAGKDSILVRFEGDVSPAAPPRIAGSRVAWVQRVGATREGDLGGKGDLVVVDLETGERITFPVEAGRTFPALSEEAVVWVDVRLEPAQLLAYEFATGSVRPLTDGEVLPLSPAAGGRYIVWVGYRTSFAGSGDPEVFVHDLATGEKRRLTTAAGAAVSGDHVVVIGSRGLRVLRVSTKEELDPSSGDRSQVLPDVDGERVVWMETSPGRRDILLMDLGSGETRRINRSVAGLSRPAISGDRVVWQDEEGGVLLYTIPSR